MKDLRKYYILSETILFLIFIFLDLRHQDSSLFKYSGIVLCLIHTLFVRNIEGSLAFCLTLAADWFLLIQNTHYPAGVLFFLLVQAVYAHILVQKGCRLLLPLRTFLLALSQIVLVLLKRCDLLNSMVLFYFTLLVGNLFSSFTNKKLRIMSGGFLLFVCCDICVGLFNLLDPGTARNVAAILMWIFYLPSQVLLALGQDTDQD